MKCRFFLLDVNEAHDAEKPTVRMWGIDDVGRRIVILANQIKPYFYAVPTKDDELASIRDGLSHSTEKSTGPIKVTQEEKKILGHRRKVLNVTCTDYDTMNRYVREIPKFSAGTRCYEQDIRLPVRYIIDCMLTPCGWNECDIHETEPGDLKVNRAYLASDVVGGVKDEKVPNLRLIAFSLLIAAERGSAKAERDPIRAIAAVTNSGESKTFVNESEDDSDALKEFASFINQLDPDIVIGFDNNRQDWPYLIERGKLCKIRLSVARDGSEPHSSLFGHISIAGRANLDLADVAEGFPDLKIKTLENFAKYLLVPSAGKITTIEEFERYKLWTEKQGRKRLVQDALLRAEVSLELAEATINFPMQLAMLTGLTLDQVVTAAVGFRVDSYLMREAYRQNELIPPRNEQPYFTYRGAIVLEPKTGLHDNVAILDFISMYPKLMENYNLSPDTLVRPDEEVDDGSVFIIPDVKYKFRKEPDGFYRTVIRTLIKQRENVKAELKSLKEQSTRYRVLTEREKVLKIITNACYGYAGWAGARWYVREVAESAAALGRDTITKTIAKADSLELPIIYGDTDSIFVKNEREKIKKLIAWATDELDLEIRVAHEYTRMLFTEAMKRYAGIRKDDTLDIVGLEVVRGDWSEIARKVQEEVIESVLRDQSTENAIQRTRAIIHRLQNGDVPIADLIIRKTLTKPIEDYRVRSPHVEVAKKLLKQGWYLAVGDKIGYVITKGKGKLFEKAEPYTQVKQEQVDVEYYLENQVKPAAMRILEPFGVSAKQLA